MWLVHEGYVTEFIDGRLFAPPPMVEARKKEVESEDHDPENFPEVQAETPAPAAPAAETAAPAATEQPAAPAPETPAASVESSPVEAAPVADQPVVPTETPAVEGKTSGDDTAPSI
jgi:hypothetical protein